MGTEQKGAVLYKVWLEWGERIEGMAFFSLVLASSARFQPRRGAVD